MTEPTEEHEDPTLAQAFREGLHARAESVGFDNAPALVHRAGAAVRRRRRRRTDLVAAAAVVGVVGAGGAAFALTQRPPPGGEPSIRSTTTIDPGGWRTEAFGGVAVDVPASWGWGTAPTGGPGGDVFFCGGPGAVVRSDGRVDPNATADRPWVGRPIMLSDACQAGGFRPEADYVWLGADIAAGTLSLPGGYTQETVAADGTTVTVGTDDDALRRQVLATVRAEKDCRAALPRAPHVESILTEGLGQVTGAQLCAYRSPTPDGGLPLVYATTLDAVDAQAYARAIGRAPKTDPAGCTDATEFVVIDIQGLDREGTTKVDQTTVVTPTCGRHTVGQVGDGIVEASPGDYRRLTGPATDPWSHNGLRAVLLAFIGMLG